MFTRRLGQVLAIAFTLTCVAVSSAVVGRATSPSATVAVATRASLVHFVPGKPYLLTIRRAGTDPFPENQGALLGVSCVLEQSVNKKDDWFPVTGTYYKRSQEDPFVATFAFSTQIYNTNGVGTLKLRITTPPIEIDLPTDPTGLDYPCPANPGNINFTITNQPATNP